MEGRDVQALVAALDVQQAELQAHNEELSRAYKAIEASRNCYAQLYDFAPVGYVTVNGQHSILQANRTAEALFGVERRELVGMALTAFVHPEAQNDYRRFVLGAFRSCRKSSIELELVNKQTGRVFDAYLEGLCVEDDKPGEYGRLWITISDVTERVQAKQELERSVAERTQDLSKYKRRLRHLASELTRLAEAERRRIASEMHDDLAQLLVFCRMGLSGLLQVGNRDELAKRIEGIDHALGEAIQYTRTLIAELNPKVLYEQGLSPALRWLAAQMEQHGITVRVVEEGPLPALSEDAKILVFRAVRELLLNVAKHAGVQHAEVFACPAEKEGVIVRVTDEGKGFVVQHGTAPGRDGAHYGLVSVAEQVTAFAARKRRCGFPSAAKRTEGGVGMCMGRGPDRPVVYVTY